MNNGVSVSETQKLCDEWKYWITINQNNLQKKPMKTKCKTENKTNLSIIRTSEIWEVWDWKIMVKTNQVIIVEQLIRNKDSALAVHGKVNSKILFCFYFVTG